MDSMQRLKLEQKKQEQILREQKRHRWISGLSWGTLLLAFGSFCGIWHHLGTASAQTTTSISSSVDNNSDGQGTVDDSQGNVSISQNQQPVIISSAS